MARHREFEPTEVIDKSIDIFLSKGYEGAAIRDLIEVTNVKSGSLYNSFGSKINWINSLSAHKRTI